MRSACPLRENAQRLLGAGARRCPRHHGPPLGLDVGEGAPLYDQLRCRSGKALAQRNTTNTSADLIRPRNSVRRQKRRRPMRTRCEHQPVHMRARAGHFLARSLRFAALSCPRGPARARASLPVPRMVRNAMKKGLPGDRLRLVTGSYREEARFDVVRRIGSQSQASRLPPARRGGCDRRGRRVTAGCGRAASA